MDPEGQVRPYSQIKMCMCVILNMGWVDMYIVVMMVDVSGNEGVEEKRWISISTFAPWKKFIPLLNFEELAENLGCWKISYN
jgi:hypothetical protein